MFNAFIRYLTVFTSECNSSQVQLGPYAPFSQKLGEKQFWELYSLLGEYLEYTHSKKVILKKDQTGYIVPDAIAIHEKLRRLEEDSKPLKKLSKKKQKAFYALDALFTFGLPPVDFPKEIVELIPVPSKEHHPKPIIQEVHIERPTKTNWDRIMPDIMNWDPVHEEPLGDYHVVEGKDNHHHVVQGKDNHHHVVQGKDNHHHVVQSKDNHHHVVQSKDNHHHNLVHSKDQHRYELAPSRVTNKVNSANHSVGSFF